MRCVDRGGWMVRGVLALAACVFSAGNALAQCGPDGFHDSGAVYRICMPGDGLWNGGLIVFAHGYVSADQPIGIPEGQLEIDGVSIPEVANLLGFGFATTSYRVNGLAIKEGLDDILELVDIFSAIEGEPNRIYLIGPSEGGLITTLGLELYPEVFDGGLSMCGPTGDFVTQINYIGDFRILFDYYFPGVIPGSATEIPQNVIDEWDIVYKQAVQKTIAGDPERTLELLDVADAPVDFFDPANLEASIENTVLVMLWYNIFGTNDATAKLGGLPYDNMNRVYSGSSDDVLLNASVPRFAADEAALAEIATYYQPLGALTVPQVTLHTTADEIISWLHPWVYLLRTVFQDSFEQNTYLPISRYGHCNFTVEEVLLSFALLVDRVGGGPLLGLDAVYDRVAPETRWPAGNSAPRISNKQPSDDATQEFKERLLELGFDSAEAQSPSGG